MSKKVKIAICALAWMMSVHTSIAGESLSEKYAVPASAKEVDSAYVEEQVRVYFADIPVMIEIARCESNFRQYQEDGRLLENPNPKSSASGVFQILYRTHKASWSASEDTDITTLMGNLAYARQLYEESGTNPWKPSRGCWDRRLAQN